MGFSVCSAAVSPAPRESFQALKVAGEDFEVVETSTDTGEQRPLSRRRPFGELVERPTPVLANGNEARAPKIGQMTRDLGLDLSEDFAEIADAKLTTLEEVENAQPRKIGESPEQR
jgi:hypothetical protein